MTIPSIDPPRNHPIMPSTPTIHEYPYRESLLMLVFFFLFFLLLTPIGVVGAWKCDDPINVKGIIELRGIAASLFLWSGALVIVMMTLITGRFLEIRILCPDQRIAFTEDGIRLPRTRWSTEEEFLLLDEIEMMDVETYRGSPTFLHLDTLRGRFSVARNKLTEHDFQEIRCRIKSFLNSACNGDMV